MRKNRGVMPPSWICGDCLGNVRKCLCAPAWLPESKSGLEMCYLIFIKASWLLPRTMGRWEEECFTLQLTGLFAIGVEIFFLFWEMKGETHPCK